MPDFPGCAWGHEKEVRKSDKVIRATINSDRVDVKFSTTKKRISAASGWI